MNVERETIVEAGISLASVGVFIVAVLAVGTTFRTNGHISGTGGLAILGAIVLFVLVMGAVGYWLASRE